MKENFPASLAHVLTSEGGFSDDPLDPGGATNRGITQAVYDAWRKGEGLPARSVKLLNDYETGVIYRRRYWDACSCDLLPGGVDYCVFDCAVNSGSGKAAKLLQTAAGVPADGSIGPVTLAAVNAADPRRIINGICSERLAFLETLPTWAHFGKGWGARVASVEQDARSMAA